MSSVLPWVCSIPHLYFIDIPDLNAPELLNDLIAFRDKLVLRNHRDCAENAVPFGASIGADFILKLRFATKARESFRSPDERLS